jgi:hypothetical protein
LNQSRCTWCWFCRLNHSRMFPSLLVWTLFHKVIKCVLCFLIIRRNQPAEEALNRQVQRQRAHIPTVCPVSLVESASTLIQAAEPTPSTSG